MKSDSHHVSRWYWFGRAVCSWIFRHCYRVIVEGLENVPETGAAVIAPTHGSYLDPPLVGVVLRRHATFVAKIELHRGILGWLFDRWEIICVNRDNPNRNDLKRVFQRLNEGRLVVIFPEGTRSPDGNLQPFEHGVAVFGNNCSVIPVAILGAHKAWPPNRAWPRLGQQIIVRFGEPITNGNNRTETTINLRAAIERLIAT